MYLFDSRVRYSETDENGRLTPLSMINYLQDCSTFQSEDLGIGVDWLRERRRAWLLNSWRILIDRAPALGERIEVGTFAHGFRGIYGYRHFFIRDAAGAFCVRADSIWFLCDTDTMTPVKVTPEFGDPYMRDSEVEHLELHMGVMKRKLRLPEQLSCLGEVPVMRHHLDTNHHVNNAQYIEIALEACGLQRPAEIQAEYRRAAVLGDMLHLYAGSEEPPADETLAADRARGTVRSASADDEIGGTAQQTAAGGGNGVGDNAACNESAGGAVVVGLCDAEKKPYAVVKFRGAL